MARKIASWHIEGGHSDVDVRQSGFDEEKPRIVIEQGSDVIYLDREMAVLVIDAIADVANSLPDPPQEKK